MTEWTDEDAEYGRKVGYTTTSGATSTAYLDTHLGEGRYGGTDKHTDEPVTVTWCGDEYIEDRG